MKIIFKLLFIVMSIVFFATPVFSQKITFTLYEFNPCTETVKLSSFFFLIDKANETYMSDSTGTCILPDTGKYIIYIPAEPQEERIFKEFKEYVDTINLSKILVLNYDNSDIFGYNCCGEDCDGKQTNYFSNGNKRLESEFKKGKPVGKMYIYYNNGKLKEIRKYNKRHKLKMIYHYNEEGKLIEKKKR